jgi:hypothetical protein
MDPDPGGPKTCGSGGSESGCESIGNTGYDAVKVKMLQIPLYILIFLLTVFFLVQFRLWLYFCLAVKITLVKMLWKLAQYIL